MKNKKQNKKPCYPDQGAERAVPPDFTEKTSAISRPITAATVVS